MSLTIVVAYLGLFMVLNRPESVGAVQESTNQLMRDIVLNQSTDFYDEEAIQHLRASQGEFEIHLKPPISSQF